MNEPCLMYNDDGWSTTMRYPAPMSPQDVLAVTVVPVIGTAVKVYQFCSLGGHAVNYTSSFLPRVGEMMEKVDSMHVWRMRETLRHLETRGTDPLRIVSEACRQHGIACQFSLRLNDRHHTYKHADGSWYFPELLSPWLDEHPELLLPDRALDYSKAGVSDYRRKQILEVLDTYNVDGIDLDFTRFRPWFRPGDERAGMPTMTRLIRDLRGLTHSRGKTLSARFEYDPQSCIASGLDVETWLREGLLDQVTLGGVGDHTPDAPSDWWVERAHAVGCKVFPGIEGQLHWCPGAGGGGTGLNPGNGVGDGYGPPSLAYMRAVAATHYRSGADGISLFNFTCADGAYCRDALDELADPRAMEGRDKQYVLALWPWDAQIYYAPWQSQFRLAPREAQAQRTFRMADDFAAHRHRGRSFTALLTAEWKGLNRLGDVEVRLNGTLLRWDGSCYNHYDHGCWNDIVCYTVPPEVLRQGTNTIELRRVAESYAFDGDAEVRKCILDVRFDRTVTLGSPLGSACTGAEPGRDAVACGAAIAAPKSSPS